eukprot:COSAG06_NODE_250_length_19080_cov_6.483029_9_plen_59_part_00
MKNKTNTDRDHEKNQDDVLEEDLITVFAPLPPQELFLGLGQTYASSVSGEPAVQQAAT